MLQVLGWLGFWLLLGTLVPLFLRRQILRKIKTMPLIRYHHSLAMVSLGVLSLHGLWALSGGRGWRRGFWSNHSDQIVYGVIAWSLLLAICLLALLAYQQRPFSRKHCWLTGLLTLFVILHVFV